MYHIFSVQITLEGGLGGESIHYSQSSILGLIKVNSVTILSLPKQTKTNVAPLLACFPFIVPKLMTRDENVLITIQSQEYIPK